MRPTSRCPRVLSADHVFESSLSRRRLVAMVPVLPPFTFPAPVPAGPIAHGEHRPRPGIQIQDHLTPGVAMAALRDVEPDAPDVVAHEPRPVRPAGQAAIPAVPERLA